MFDHPIRLFFLSLAWLWLSTQIGTALRRWRALKELQPEFALIQSATFTLLALIIGFSFSLAINRYDQRKNYEEEEANAIGTEYLRTEVLPPADTLYARGLLRRYLDLRISFFLARDEDQLRKSNSDTAQLQSKMWSAVRIPSAGNATPVVALAVSGMNDVLNSQGYTQASYWNRIPSAAWDLMIFTAIGCHLLLGYGSPKAEGGRGLMFVMALVVSLSFLLIADIDSPRRGFIHVVPQNLISLSQSLPVQ